MYIPNEYANAILEEERRLLREISAGGWSWKKLGLAIRLNALLRAHNSPF